MPPRTSEPQIDALRFRDILGRFPTGVVAISALEPGTGQPAGLVANSFTSVSLDPPLVAFCVTHTSTSWPRIRLADRFGISILGEQQLAVAGQLAARGGDKFRGLQWRCSPGGTPILVGSTGWLECAVEVEHPAGDHVIVVCRVHQLGDGETQRPLVFHRSRYGRVTGATPR